jgi:enoyl-CoA hydratase
VTQLVEYTASDGVATVQMDDGKVNVLSPGMLTELAGALDRAEADNEAVILTGRPGMFSAGFDLAVLQGGGRGAIDMLMSGFDLARRMLSFPRPIVIACPGHAIAMGSFLLLCGDHRIGVSGPYRITANEVAIGLTMPHAAIEICRDRLTPAAFHRAVALAEVFTPETAEDAGFLDQLVEPAAQVRVASEVAARLAGLDPRAHRATKARTRAGMLQRLDAAVNEDRRELDALLPT